MRFLFRLLIRVCPRTLEECKSSGLLLRRVVRGYLHPHASAPRQKLRPATQQPEHKRAHTPRGPRPGDPHGSVQRQRTRTGESQGQCARRERQVLLPTSILHEEALRQVDGYRGHQHDGDNHRGRQR